MSKSVPILEDSKPPSFHMSRPDTLVSLMFKQHGYVQVDDVELADVVVFGGGADINPLLYGEPVLRGTRPCLHSDRADIDTLRRTTNEQFKVGICRGAQFLNVMVGNGRLWQDVTNHATKEGHLMYEVDAKGRPFGDKLWVSSTHHQMMIPGKDGAVLWAAGEAQVKTCKQTTERRSEDAARNACDDAEVIYYYHNNALCYQPHPEYNGKDNERNQQNFMELLDLYALSPGQVYARNKRMKKETT